MNEHRKIPAEQRLTQAAEGLPRWRWTLAEFDRFIELGIFGEDDRVELIGGELVPMAAKGNRHELVKSELTDWMYRRLPEDMRLVVELGWRPGGDNYLEPDLVLLRRSPDPSAVKAGDALLIVEIAKSSLAGDLGWKANLYAALGVRDYWVVNAETLQTRVHREPGADGFQSVKELTAGEALTPLLVRSLTLQLAELNISS